MKVFKTFLFLIAACIEFLPAQAQTISIGPTVGIYKATDAENTRFTGGVALRLRAATFGIEGSIGYRQEQYAQGLVTVTTWPIMVTGLIYPLPFVYGAIGTGWYNATVDYNYPPGYLGPPTLKTSETQQKFGWHFGGGVDIPVAPAVRIVGDIRYVFLNYNFSQVPAVDVNSNFYIINAGLQFNL